MDTRNSRPCSPRLLEFVRDMPSPPRSLPFLPSPKPPSTRSQPRLEYYRSSLTSRDISHQKDRHRRVLSTDFSPQSSVASLLAIKAYEGGLPTDFQELRERLKDERIDNVPTSRRDVEILIVWLDRMLETISQGDLTDAKKVYEHTSAVYENCFREVLKQVYTQCAERGLLLQRVWTAYQGLSDRYIKQAQVANQRISEQWQDALQQASAKWKTREDALQRQLYDSEELREQLQQTIETLRKERDQSQRTCSRLNGQLVQLKSSVIKSKRKVYYLREENRVLALRLKNVAASPISTPLSQRSAVRFKPRSTEMIEECNLYTVFAQDPEIQNLQNEEIAEERHIEAYEDEVEKVMCQPDFREEMTSIGGLVVQVDREVQVGVNTVETGVQVEKRTVGVENVESWDIFAEVEQHFRVGDAEANLEGIDNFQIDLHKIITHQLSSDQLEAIEESLFKHFSPSSQQRFPYSSDSSPRETIEIASKQEPEIGSSDHTAMLTDRERSEKLEEPGKRRARNRLKTRVDTVVGLLQAKRTKTTKEIPAKETQGMILVRKYLSEGKKSRRILPKKSLSRIITWIYLEKIAQRREKETLQNENLATFLYELFAHKYGFEKLAERKVNQLLGSCLQYKSDLKVSTFSRFIGLVGTCNPQELTWYLRALEYISKSQQSTDIDGEEVTYIPLLKALECSKHLFDSVLSAQSLAEFKSRLEEQKTTDRRASLKSARVEVDGFLQEIVRLGRIEENRESARIHTLLSALNVLQGTKLKTLNLAGFLRLQKAVSSMDSSLAEGVFHHIADVGEGTEKAVTLQALVAANRRWRIFTEEDLRRFCPHSAEADFNTSLQHFAAYLEKVQPRLKDEEAAISQSLLALFHSEGEQEAAWLALRMLDEDSREPFISTLSISLLPTLSRLVLCSLLPNCQ